MDGGQTVLSLPLELRIRVNRSASFVRALDPSQVPARVPVALSFRDGELVSVDQHVIGGKSWFVLRGTAAGLPVIRDEHRNVDRFSWRGLWDDEIIELEFKVGGGSWVKVEVDDEWGKFYATEA